MNEEGEDVDRKFVQFVDSVFLHHGSGLLHKFRLVWRYRSILPSQVDSWISSAVTKNVSQLVLSLDRFERKDSEQFEIPTCVFICETLRYMELEGIMWVPDSIVVCLPRLETLKLVSVHFKSEEACQKLIQGCPMLHYLHLHVLTGYHLCEDDRFVFRYVISSTSLRRLELVIAWRYKLIIPCSLELESPSLEYLKIKGFIHHIFLKGSLRTLVEADLRIHWMYCVEYNEDTYNSFVEVVRAFQCAKSLTLSTHVMLALSRAATCWSTKFSRLTKFVAGADGCCYRSLEDFIQNSDNLEVLTIYQDSTYAEENVHDFSNWTAPVEVPRCLSNSLRVVVFDGYSGSDNEREMIGYILKHGRFLEVMKISCYNHKHVKYELVQEICKFPRKSPACKVEFFTSRLCGP